MYCLGCGYNLADIQPIGDPPRHMCPECGRAFDPHDDRTWTTWTGRHAVRSRGLDAVVTITWLCARWALFASIYLCVFFIGLLFRVTVPYELRWLMSMFLIASILFIGGGIIVALPVACVLLFSATRYEIRARRNPKRSERLTYHIMGTFGILLIDVILICSGV